MNRQRHTHARTKGAAAWLFASGEGFSKTTVNRELLPATAVVEILVLLAPVGLVVARLVDQILLGLLAPAVVERLLLQLPLVLLLLPALVDQIRLVALVHHLLHLRELVRIPVHAPQKVVLHEKRNVLDDAPRFGRQLMIERVLLRETEGLVALAPLSRPPRRRGGSQSDAPWLPSAPD